MTGLYKNTIILSNYTHSEVFNLIDSKYSTRLTRRTIWAEVGSDPWLLNYLRPNFAEIDIDSDLILFHFWYNIMLLQSEKAWKQDLVVKYENLSKSYEEFCKENEMKNRLGNSFTEDSQQLDISSIIKRAVNKPKIVRDRRMNFPRVPEVEEISEEESSRY